MKKLQKAKRDVVDQDFCLTVVIILSLSFSVSSLKTLIMVSNWLVVLVWENQAVGRED